ncbi:MAG: lysozyme inhibitor LprI family protein [Prochlorococcaceae cyanobacterium]
MARCATCPPALRVGLAVGILAILAPVARADDPTGGYFSGTQLECPGIPAAEAALVACHRMALQNADRELNSLYRNLMAQADPQERRALEDAQLAWIHLRDAQCALVEAYYRDAPVPDKWTSRCQAVQTIRRVQELRALGTGIGW